MDQLPIGAKDCRRRLPAFQKRFSKPTTSGFFRRITTHAFGAVIAGCAFSSCYRSKNTTGVGRMAIKTLPGKAEGSW
jgi:hypothetical protein